MTNNSPLVNPDLLSPDYDIYYGSHPVDVTLVTDPSTNCQYLLVGKKNKEASMPFLCFLNGDPLINSTHKLTAIKKQKFLYLNIYLCRDSDTLFTHSHDSHDAAKEAWKHTLLSSPPFPGLYLETHTVKIS